MTDSPWMNPRETADYLRVSERHVHRLKEGKGLPHERVGKKVLFHRDEVDKWVKNST